MNVTLAEAEVVARCNKAGVAISAIETLPTGGTHVVTVTPGGAETMRGVFGKALIETKQRRFAFTRDLPLVRE
jgi:hypothetical protein